MPSASPTPSDWTVVTSRRARNPKFCANPEGKKGGGGSSFGPNPNVDGACGGSQNPNFPPRPGGALRGGGRERHGWAEAGRGVGGVGEREGGRGGVGEGERGGVGGVGEGVGGALPGWGFGKDGGGRGRRRSRSRQEGGGVSRGERGREEERERDEEREEERLIAKLEKAMEEVAASAFFKGFVEQVRLLRVAQKITETDPSQSSSSPFFKSPNGTENRSTFRNEGSIEPLDCSGEQGRDRETSESFENAREGALLIDKISSERKISSESVVFDVRICEREIEKMVPNELMGGNEIKKGQGEEEKGGLHPCERRIEEGEKVEIVEYVESTESLESTENVEIVKNVEIVVYGVGSLTDSAVARCQLALGRLLANEIQTGRPHVWVYDPVLTQREVRAMRALSCRALPRNEEGRRVAEEPTIFFMPHCEAHLYNNVVEANWKPPGSLERVSVLGNSFRSYQERWAVAPRPKMARPDHLLEVQPFTEEHPVDPCDFPLPSAFNDMSWHFFPTTG